MTSYVIVGAGASGLYTAYRLLSEGMLGPDDTVRVHELGERPGGRIRTFTFPASVYPEGQTPNGLYAEAGGMRFAVDGNFPKSIVEGHVLVQNMVLEMGLENLVVDFDESPQRMYHLRGTTVFEDGLSSLDALKALPYGFNGEFLDFVAGDGVPKPYTADNLLGSIAGRFAPNLGSSNADRAKWCEYYAGGTVDASSGTTAFPEGTPIRDIGYWNLLYDQFGDEGFDYTADATGYTSNVINWSAADAMQANNDYGSSTSYKRLDGGYGRLFDSLAGAVERMAAERPGSGVFYGSRLSSLGDLPDGRTACLFDGPDGVAQIDADHLFLAMPRRSLELVARNCPPDYMLNSPPVKYYLESSIDQPAIKVLMVFDQAWWTECPSAPMLVTPAGAAASQGVGGPSITDLPLRMVYYFANNVPGGPGTQGGPYVLLASYDDMSYSDFWRQLEERGDFAAAPSSVEQPVTGPTEVPAGSAMTALLIKQLAELHGTTPDRIPAPTGVFYQDWGQDPYGAGYHGWSAHYDICQAMDRIRAPNSKILVGSAQSTYIVGSCYSFDQAWVEGAFCVAESVLQEFFGLAPFAGVDGYTLVCGGGDGTGDAASAQRSTEVSATVATPRQNRAHR